MAKVKAIPEGQHSVTPVLVLKGCAEAIELYKKAFGAEEITRAPDPSGKLVWHADLKIGDSHIFMNDEMPGMSPARGGSIWLYVENVDAVFKRAKDAGMKETMPLADMFWGDRFGALMDRFGVSWSVAQHVRDMSPAEMQKAQDEFVKQQGANR